MKLGLLGDALLLWRWKLLLLWIAFLPWRMKILLLWYGLLSSAVEVASAMESQLLYGRGMPRPISMPFFFRA